MNVVMRVNVGKGPRADVPWARGAPRASGHGYYGEHQLENSHRMNSRGIGHDRAETGQRQEGGRAGWKVFQSHRLPWKLSKEQGRAAAAALEKIIVKNAALTYPEKGDVLALMGKELVGSMVGRFRGWHQDHVGKNGYERASVVGKERYRSALEKVSYLTAGGVRDVTMSDYVNE